MIDALAFATLFHAADKNHAEICRCLALIASAEAGKFRWRCRHDREDAAGEALVAAIERIGRYDAGRRRRGALLYFQILIHRVMVRELAKHNRRERSLDELLARDSDARLQT